MKRTALILAATLALHGCATTVGSDYVPLVDRPGPNFSQDLAECQEYAKGEASAAEMAAAGAVFGAVIMAVASALVLDQSVDRGSLALGALSGAAGGAGHATVNQESVIKNCMAGRGYSVLR